MTGSPLVRCDRCTQCRQPRPLVPGECAEAKSRASRKVGLVAKRTATGRISPAIVAVWAHAGGVVSRPYLGDRLDGITVVLSYWRQSPLH